VIDIVRDQPETQKEVLGIALAARDSGCVALGLGGNETGFPPELFVETFMEAQQAGLPRVPHAGETLGAASVWTAIDQLQATRIGRGVRSIEDNRLVREAWPGDKFHSRYARPAISGWGFMRISRRTAAETVGCWRGNHDRIG
jgi:hypothetical protein